MLTDEQMAVLPDWVKRLTLWNGWGLAEIDPDCRCDTCMKRKLIVTLADALLTRQRDRQRLRRVLRRAKKWRRKAKRYNSQKWSFEGQLELATGELATLGAERDELQVDYNQLGINYLKLETERDGLAARLAEAREVLRSLEWSVHGTNDDHCPSCGRGERNGHWEKCKLAAVLREGE